MISTFPLTLTRKNAAVSASAWFHTSDPGTFDVDYPPGITGPATVTAAGSRAWRNGLKHGQYLARANCLQARDNCAWFFEIDPADLFGFDVASTANLYPIIPICSNIKTNVVRRINWGFHLARWIISTSQQVTRLTYYQSNAAANAETLSNPNVNPTYNVLPFSAPLRIIVTADGRSLLWYWTTGTTSDGSATRGTTTGIMGSPEATIIQFPMKFAKMEGSLPSQAQREAFMSAGTLPAGLAASYQGGHEINPAAPVFYDTSGNGLDLSDVDVQ